MTRLAVNTSAVIEFRNPTLGLNPQAFTKWTEELQETALKAHQQLGKVVIQNHISKLVDASWQNGSNQEVIQVGCTYNTEIKFNDLMNEIKNKVPNFFEVDNNHINNYIAGASSYGISYSMHAYDMDGTEAGGYLRKYGQMDQSQFREAKVNRALAVNEPLKYQILCLEEAVKAHPNVPNPAPIGQQTITNQEEMQPSDLEAEFEEFLEYRSPITFIMYINPVIGE